MKRAKLLKRFRIDNGDKFRLDDFDPKDTCGLDFTKDDAKAMLAEASKELSDHQEKLYAQDRWSVLIVLQAMDAAGKDGAIKHVMSGVNPQGCQVHSFKAPSAEELDHDFLWRIAKALPERGRIGIFNRSHYEDVLVVRVHPEILARQRLPQELTGKEIWDERFKSIREFERHLARNGTLVLKFLLNVSKKVQRERFLERLDRPEKHWKFSVSDLEERKHWSEYQVAFEQMIQHTSTKQAPWWVIPADNKWVTRTLVAGIITRSIERLGLTFPKVSDKDRKRLEAARVELMAGK